jgi:hypothetical protein
MLHYYGDSLALELGYSAMEYLWMYAKEEIALVPFFDLRENRKRYVKFEKLVGQWVFVDIID